MLRIRCWLGGPHAAERPLLERNRSRCCRCQGRHAGWERLYQQQQGSEIGQCSTMWPALSEGQQDGCADVAGQPHC